MLQPHHSNSFHARMLTMVLRSATINMAAANPLWLTDQTSGKKRVGICQDRHAVVSAPRGMKCIRQRPHVAMFE